MKNNSLRFWLIMVLILAFLIRLAYALTADMSFLGGDQFWYLVNGAGLYMPEPIGVALGLPYAANNIPVAPLYLVITGFFQQFFSLEESIFLLRIIQSILSILVCFLAFDLGHLLTRDDRVGLVAATALAFSLSFIIEPSHILTETLYIALIVLGIWVYCKYVVIDIEQAEWLWFLLVGIFLGLATLTRAVGILFPIGICIHLLLITFKTKLRRGFIVGLIILCSYGAVISTWTVYNWLAYDRFVIVSNQMMPAIWRGVVEGDGSPRQNDEMLGEQSHTEQTTEIILNEPIAVVKRRVTELLGSYLQPHGTVSFGGAESLKELALTWIEEGFSFNRLQILLTTEGFLPKLLIYIWHYTALIAGIIGMWLTRKNWKISLVLIGFIAYTTLLHLVALALPRYIFPTYPFFWIFAAVTLVRIWDILHRRKHEAENEFSLPHESAI